MARNARLYVFVGCITVAALLSGAAIWSIRLKFPGWWPFITFVFVATLLETLNTQLRLGAKGSTSFIVHLASTLLFGAWWGAMVAAVATLLGEVSRANTALKIVFNIAQRILAVALASLAYQVLGGTLPPSYLNGVISLASPDVQRDLGLYFVFATVYFTTNAVAVNGAIVLSSGRSFREAWNLNTRGILV